LQISLSGAEVFVENLTDAVWFRDCVSLSSKTCPFGLSDCTTFVDVTSGFWTDWTDFGNISSRPASSQVLKNATRCPPGYCKYGNDSFRLPPPLVIDRKADPLCGNNRAGRLCGGCPVNFTHSLDDKSCIANAECIGNLWWVWMVSVLGFAMYSLYIVLSSGEFGDNALSCLLFYFQISSFAAIADDSSDAFQWFLEVSQVGSLVALASGACYAPNMSAYNATASKLIGPLFVFAFSAVWTAIARALQPQLQARSIRLHVSYSGTFTATFLFVFSSVCKIVFTLVKCTRYDSDGFVFIDGTVDCLDDNWKALVVVVALLCLFPVLFFAALRLNKLPPDARAVICRSFTESEFYWPALTLGFRLLVSVMLFMEVLYPNLLAFLRMILSTIIFFLLVNTRPHRFTHTFWVDVACYGCLIAQFGLQALFSDRDYLGVSLSQDQRDFYKKMKSLSVAFRFAPWPCSSAAIVACVLIFVNQVPPGWRVCHRLDEEQGFFW
jgi:hypothetical protein